MKKNQAGNQKPEPSNQEPGADHLGYLLTAYLFENLSPAGKAEVESHLATCQTCRDQLELLSATLGLAVSAFNDEGKTYVFEDRRRQRILDAAKRSRHNFIARIDPSVFRIRNWKRLAVVAAILMAVLTVIVPLFLSAGGSKSVSLFRVQDALRKDGDGSAPSRSTRYQRMFESSEQSTGKVMESKSTDVMESHTQDALVSKREDGYSKDSGTLRDEDSFIRNDTVSKKPEDPNDSKTRSFTWAKPAPAAGASAKNPEPSESANVAALSYTSTVDTPTVTFKAGVDNTKDEALKANIMRQSPRVDTAGLPQGGPTPVTPPPPVKAPVLVYAFTSTPTPAESPEPDTRAGRGTATSPANALGAPARHGSAGGGGADGKSLEDRVDIGGTTAPSAYGLFPAGGGPGPQPQRGEAAGGSVDGKKIDVKIGYSVLFSSKTGGGNGTGTGISPTGGGPGTTSLSASVGEGKNKDEDRRSDKLNVVSEFGEKNQSFGINVQKSPSAPLKTATAALSESAAEAVALPKLQEQTLAQEETSKEETRFLGERGRLRGAVLPQQQQAAAGESKLQEEVRDMQKAEPEFNAPKQALNTFAYDSTASEPQSEVVALKQKLAKSEGEKTLLQRDLSRQTQRVEGLVAKGVPVNTILQEDSAAAQPMIAPDPATTATHTSPAAKHEAEKRLKDLAQISENDATVDSERLAGESETDGRQKVALSTKDDTIRRQTDLLEKERGDKDELSKANEVLAAQNDQLSEQNAQSTKQNEKELTEKELLDTVIAYSKKKYNTLDDGAGKDDTISEGLERDLQQRPQLSESKAVITRGNTKTRDKVIIKQMELFPSDRIDTSRMKRALSAAGGVVSQSTVQLGDHFETLHPEQPVAQTAFGNPDAKMSHVPDARNNDFDGIQPAETPVQLGLGGEGQTAASKSESTVDRFGRRVQPGEAANYYRYRNITTPEPTKPAEKPSAGVDVNAVDNFALTDTTKALELNYSPKDEKNGRVPTNDRGIALGKEQTISIDALVDEVLPYDPKGGRISNSNPTTPSKNDSLYLEFPKNEPQANGKTANTKTSEKLDTFLDSFDGDIDIPKTAVSGVREATGKVQQLKNLNYFNDNVVLTPEPKENAELKILDVRDLSSTAQDFPGPDLGTTDPAKGPRPITLLRPRLDPNFPSRGDANASLTTGEIATAVRGYFANDFAQPGNTLEESGGKLVLMAKPDVQQKVENFLGTIRKDPVAFKRQWDENAADSQALVQGVSQDQLKAAQPPSPLRGKISFNFTDAPLTNVLKYLSEKSGTTITLDPIIASEVALTPVELQVKDLSTDVALEWVARLSDLRVSVENGSVVLKRPPEVLAARSDSERTLRAYNYLRGETGNAKSLSFTEFSKRPAPVPAPVLTDNGMDEDAYIEKFGTRPFVDAKRDHLSTFSMDVDTASYTRTRSQLRDNTLPDAATVRVEEFVNYFKQPYTVVGEEAFGVFAEAAPSPFNHGGNVQPLLVSKSVSIPNSGTTAGETPLQLLKIGIKSRDPKPGERKPAMLTFAIDTSGSMTRDDRLDLLRTALSALVEQLQPEDAVSIVTFSDQAQVLLPRTQARQKQRLLDAIAALHPDGGTNVEAGLALAYRIADESYSADAVNRVILCSDGVANVGAKGPEAVLKTVKVFAARGIDLSSVGFGMGKYNDEMMVKLADNGNGSCHFVDTLDEANRIFTEQLPPHLSALARDAKVQVDFNPDVVAHYRLLGYEKRKIADKDFRNDAIDAGEVQHSTLVTALYEIERTPAAQGPLGKVFLRWKDAGHRHLPVIERNFPLGENIQCSTVEGASPELRFLACVARFAELLRSSPWVQNSSYADVLEQLDRLPVEFKQRADWKEVQELVQRAQSLSVQQWSKNL